MDKGTAGGPIGFAMVPRRAHMDKRLSRGALCVLGAVCGAVRKGTTKAFIGQAKLSEHTELSRRQVNRCLAVLEACGYISRLRRTSKRTGRQLTTVYEVHYVEPERLVADNQLDGHEQPAESASVNRVTSDGTRPCDISGPFELGVRVTSDVTDSDLIDNHTLEDSSETPFAVPPSGTTSRQNLQIGRDDGSIEEAARTRRLQGVGGQNDQSYLIHSIDGGENTAAEQKGAEKRIWQRLERLGPEERERRARELMKPGRLEAEIGRELRRRRVIG